VPVGGLAPLAARELFVDRARAVRPGFMLSRGARTALPRQQTLRAVVDWSYDLLFEDERRLFSRLATFTGGCGLAAVEAVCADEQVPCDDILDVLSRLVDKSLVVAPGGGGEARFSQLQTLWQYGRDRLTESGEADAMRARHGAYYRQLAEQAHQGLRGAAGPMWRDRLVTESGNLRAALDWYIATGDADAALSLASGMAWLWFITGDFLEGARWLGDALGADGPRRPEVEATAHVWRGYCVGMSTHPAAGVIECEEAVAVLRTSHDRVRLAEALVVGATVLGFAHQFDRSLEALGEAQDLLEPASHGWLLAAHDLIVAWNLLSLGRLEDAEPVARSSLERFDAQEEVLVVVSPLNALASIAEARGDLEAASAAYEALVERCRATGQPIQVPFSLVALAALRARQGDDAVADGLYTEAIDCSFNPWVSADAMVGQAAVARRRGDLPRSRALLDAAAGHYRLIKLPAGPPRVLAGLAWWALAAGHLQDAAVFAADASEGASDSGDPATQLLAETAVAAVKAIADPTRHHVEAFVALAQRRAQGVAYRSLTDEPDVATLAARLG
jgi:tetratricopeptide (TPR) repeat protein